MTATTAFGGELGMPTKCQLGKLGGRFCQGEGVRVVRGYRICQHHAGLIDDIAMAPAVENHLRHPVASVYLRRAP